MPSAHNRYVRVISVTKRLSVSAQNIENGMTLLRVLFRCKRGLESELVSAALQLPQATLKCCRQIGVAKFADSSDVVSGSWAQRVLPQHKLHVVGAGGRTREVVRRAWVQGRVVMPHRP